MQLQPIAFGYLFEDGGYAWALSRQEMLCPQRRSHFAADPHLILLILSPDRRPEADLLSSDSGSAAVPIRGVRYGGDVRDWGVALQAEAASGRAVCGRWE
jgi:hypothetical protein